jgi:hypothetical protein
VTAGTVEDHLGWLCASAVQLTGVSCCGVTMVAVGSQSVTAHASDERARAVEDLQHTLGEGPGVAASESGAAAFVPDLENLGDLSYERWPTFAKEAVDLGVQAAFAFPLLLGTSSVGALSLYRTESGSLSEEGVQHGWVTAEAVAWTLAGSGSGSGSGFGSTSGSGSGSGFGSTAPPTIDQMDPMRVHQAAGMVMVQLGVPIDLALLRMRAAAYSEGLSVDELAEAIVQRRRRLPKEDT